MRGGDSYEVGYEFDGIPVNRAFDNYPSGSLSSLGQLELQVYTGATPSNAEAQGLAGFVNQVIKTGNLSRLCDVRRRALGTPTFYHSLNVEAGGATPDRMFSYYVGIGGYNQDHRYVDQFGGAAYANEFGQQLGQLSGRASERRRSCRRATRTARRTSGRTARRAGFSGRSASARSTPPTSPRAPRSSTSTSASRTRTTACATTFSCSTTTTRSSRPSSARSTTKGYNNWLQHGRQPFRRTIWTRGSIAARSAPFCRRTTLAGDAVPLSVVAAASVRRPDSRSVQSARPRLQRPGDRQAAVPEELQLQRVSCASTATRTTRTGSRTVR